MFLYKKKASGREGFTLIELGVVMAVLSLLASGVMAGKGFMNAAGVSKALDAIDKTRIAVETYVARRGGQWQSVEVLEQSTGAQLATKLVERHLLAQMPWDVGPIQIKRVVYGTMDFFDAVMIQVEGPAPAIFSVYDGLGNHRLFRPDASSTALFCADAQEIYPNTSGVATVNLCFARSL